MDYVTVPGIEIIKTGTYTDRNGNEFAVTRDDLAAMVEASANLPNPVVKIGHVNEAVENPDWGDGAPAFGQLANLQLADDGDTLKADWVNAPADLAEKQPSAYPNRSMEATYNLTLRDQNGDIAEQYPVVLTGVALLGATQPAVKTLDQVHAEFSGTWEGRVVHASGTRSVQIFASLPGGKTQRELDDALRSAVHALESGDEFIMLVDWTDEVAYYQAEGMEPRTYQRGYEVAEDGTVTWTTDPVEVVARHTFEPVSTSQDAAGAPVPHQQASLAESGHTDAAEPVANPRREGATTMLSDETLAALRKQLGLPEDATVSQIEEAVQGTQDDQGTTGADGQAGGEQDGSGQSQDGGEQGQASTAPAAPEPVAASAPAGVETVQVSKAQLDTMLQEQAQMKVQLSQIDQEKQQVRVDAAIHEAKQAGKIHPNDEDNVRTMFASAPDATEQYLQSLTPVIPVEERGSHKAQFAEGVDDAIDRAKENAYRNLFQLPTDDQEDN